MAHFPDPFSFFLSTFLSKAEKAHSEGTSYCQTRLALNSTSLIIFKKLEGIYHFSPLFPDYPSEKHVSNGSGFHAAFAALHLVQE